MINIVRALWWSFWRVMLSFRSDWFLHEGGDSESRLSVITGIHSIHAQRKEKVPRWYLLLRTVLIQQWMEASTCLFQLSHTSKESVRGFSRTVFESPGTIESALPTVCSTSSVGYVTSLYFEWYFSFQFLDSPSKQITWTSVHILDSLVIR